jgi:hypothetical protein
MRLFLLGLESDRFLMTRLYLSYLEGLILLISRNDTRLNTGAIEIGLPKIGLHPIWTVEKDLEHTKASLAAEMKDLPIENLFLLRASKGKATKGALHLMEIFC